MKKDLSIFGLLVALCLITASQNHNFFNITNLTNLCSQNAAVGVIAVGMTLVIIAGGIDLSIGSMIALVGVLLPMALREWHWPWPL